MNDLITDVWKDQQVNKDQPVNGKHNIDTGEGKITANIHRVQIS